MTITVANAKGGTVYGASGCAGGLTAGGIAPTWTINGTDLTGVGAPFAAPGIVKLGTGVNLAFQNTSGSAITLSQKPIAYAF